LTDLVGELSMRSEEFRTRWAAHNVRLHRTGLKDIHHPVVGDLHLMFEALDLPADPGLSLVVYSAELASPSQDALNLLASWAATLDQADETAVAEAAHEEAEPRPGATARQEH
jgi:MmyB-like transcription regulator ligand binding domain